MPLRHVGRDGCVEVDLSTYYMKRYQGHGLDLLDLIQEGSLGLMRAALTFDWRRGYRFSTMATW